MTARIINLRLRRLERKHRLEPDYERIVAALSDEDLEAAVLDCGADLVRRFGGFDAAVEATRERSPEDADLLLLRRPLLEPALC